jgi:agmatinase
MRETTEVHNQPYVQTVTGIVGQVDARAVPRYAGIGTFARLPQRHEVGDYDIAVVGVPFDSGVTYRPGARFGPAAIRQASRLLKPYHPALDVAPFSTAQVVDAGDIAANPFDIDAAVDEIRAGILGLLTRPEQLQIPSLRSPRRVVLLGGDHTIALPALQAMNQVHGPVALVHFDAHLDTWDTYFGAPCTHGSPFRRASEQGLLVKDHSAHVGIRGSLYDRADLLEDAELGFTAVHCRDIDRIGVDGVIERVLARVGEHPVYVSIDVDVLDPAFAPGTGTPEIGGMTSRELVAVLRAMRALNIVGADVVEVAPAYDQAEITAVAGANLAYELITLMVDA